MTRTQEIMPRQRVAGCGHFVVYLNVANARLEQVCDRYPTESSSINASLPGCSDHFASFCALWLHSDSLVSCLLILFQLLLSLPHREQENISARLQEPSDQLCSHCLSCSCPIARLDNHSKGEVRQSPTKSPPGHTSKLPC